MKNNQFLPVQMSLLALIFGVLLMFSCQQDTPANAHANTHPDVAPDKSFEPFYQKFHQDSAYQMAHIHFPLQGLPQDVDSSSLAQKDFYWTRDSWKIQHDFVKSSGYSQTITAVTPNMVEELILHPSGQFGIVRRFAKLGDEWYLIYFSGLHRVRQ